MTRFIKRLLFKFLGQKNYLKTMHVFFFFFYKLGVLKGNHLFKYHYFVPKLVKEGDCVVDIGANLGYFSKIFSSVVGKTGKVVCIEPVKPFYETLVWGLKNKKNCTIHNYALGLEKKSIEMVLPKMNGDFRTGLAHISKKEIDKSNYYSFDVEMVKGSELLLQLEKIDYIKCDIEGYEEFVIPEIKEVLIKFKPIVQIELDGEHKQSIIDLFLEVGYVLYGVYDGKLIKDFSNITEEGDLLFIHSTKEKEVLQGI